MKIIVLFLIFFSNIEVYADSHKAVVTIKIDHAEPLENLDNNEYLKRYEKEVEDAKRRIEKADKDLQNAKTDNERDWARNDKINAEMKLHDAEARVKSFQNKTDDTRERSEKSWEKYPEYMNQMNNNIESGYSDILGLFPESNILKAVPSNGKNYAHYTLFISPLLDLSSTPRGSVHYLLSNNKTMEILTVGTFKNIFQGNRKMSGVELADLFWSNIIMNRKIPSRTLIQRTIINNVPYIWNIDMKYKHNTKNKEADGKEKGILEIRNIENAISFGHMRPMNLIEYEIKAEYGKFIKTNSNMITFTPYDYLQSRKRLKFEYQTYNCDKVKKKFETFTITRKSIFGLNGSSLRGKTKLGKIRVAFKCKDYYFTMKTIVEKIETQEVPVKTGGRNLDLKTITLKNSKQVVHIDILKDTITNVPFLEEALVKKTSERYKLNTSSCQYEMITHEDVLPYKYFPTFIRRTNPGQPFTKNTVLKLQISDGKKKEILLPWITLKEKGYFSHRSQWRKEKNKSEKATELKKMLQVSAEGQEKFSLIKIAIDYQNSLGRDAKCAIKRNFLDVLETGANIMHPIVSYKYSVNIYPASRDDIRKAKNILKRMKNGSDNYTDEKQLFDALNNALNIFDSVETEKASQLKKEPNGILDTLVDRDDEEDEPSIDDLKMYTD